MNNEQAKAEAYKIKEWQRKQNRSSEVVFEIEA